MSIIKKFCEVVFWKFYDETTILNRAKNSKFAANDVEIYAVRTWQHCTIVKNFFVQ